MTEERTLSDKHSIESNRTKYIERSDVDVSLTATLKRGTRTRDPDELTAKVEASTLNEARGDMDTLRTYLRELAGDVRQLQPSDDE